jgi:hypothetical protein
MNSTEQHLSLSGTPRIWISDQPPVAPQTALFRREFALSRTPNQAHLYISAELRYQLWVNGLYVGRGPILHHPTLLPFDCHDITPLLRPGRNLICVLVHTPAMPLHNAVPLGEPGLVAQLHVDGKLLLQTDRQWRATSQSGWSSAMPKRCWALGPIEQFDMSAAPLGWLTQSFDSSKWPAAQENSIRPAVEPVISPLPPLKYVIKEAVAAPHHLARRALDDRGPGHGPKGSQSRRP